MRRSKKRIYVLNTAICLQLTAVLFNPNLNSYTGKKVAPYILPYMNSLGLTGAWAFFAPEPSSPPVYLDYVLTKRNGDRISGRFPEHKDSFFHARKNRWHSFTNYLLSQDHLLEHMFMNFLCNKYQGIQSAEIWSVRGLQPTLEMVRAGSPISKTVDFHTEFIGNYVCKQEATKENSEEST